MKKAADVVVVGGGVMGASIAHYLARQGLTNIVVLEREEMLGTGSTGKSAGGIRLQFSSEVNIRLSLESLDVFKNFEDETGTTADFRQHGYLFVSNNTPDREEFEANARVQQGLGVPVQLLDAAGIKDLLPEINADDLVVGTFCPLDGHADPHSVVYGFAAAAQRLGVEIYTGVEATGINMGDGGRIEGVETSKGAIHTECVVNAAGPYAGVIARMVGLELPVTPYRRQVLVSGPFDYGLLPPDMPMVIDFPTSSYARRDLDAVLMGMSDHKEPSSFNTQVDQAFLMEIAETVMGRIPILEQATMATAWAGLYAVSPDDNAILGQCDVPGFYLMNGFSGHGFQHAPAVGKATAQLIIDGRSDLDISALNISRFKEGRTIEEGRVV